MAYSFLLYGSYGYTGALVAEQAVQKGLRPLLAGRDAGRLRLQAEKLGLDYRALEVTDATALESALLETPAVLHCGGPFHRTYQAVAAACLRTHRHYVDITGEIAVFEGLAAQDPAARAAGVMLLPGAGFDVVPSDCLAAHLKRRLPSATHLTLAIRSLGGGLSHGTALTMVEGIHKQGAVRQNGKIVAVPHAWKTRAVDFGRGPVTVVTTPWGDVSTAYYSTGIPNIEVYMAFAPALRSLMVASRYLGGVMGTRPMQWLLKQALDAGAPGPSADARQRGRSLLWGEVSDAQGARAATRLVTPEGYALTAQTALAIIERILKGDLRPGFCTPSLAYGADFILEFPGAQYVDLEST